MLIVASRTWVLTDFGFSRIARERGRANSTTLEPLISQYPWFMPPEVLEQPLLAHQTLKPERVADIFSCGIVFLAVGLAPMRPNSGWPSWTPSTVSSAKEAFEREVRAIRSLQRADPSSGRPLVGFSARGSALLWSVIVQATQRDEGRRRGADLRSLVQQVFSQEKWGYGAP